MHTDLSALKKRITARTKKQTPKSRVTPDPALRYAPFPLNDMQRAYWLGRNSDMKGNAAMQCYMAFAVRDFSTARFNDALNLLIERHDMLRAVVLPDGTQQVLQFPPRVSATVEDLTGMHEEDRAKRLQSIEETMWHSVSALDVWPQSEFRFSRTGQENNGILHCKFDMWCFDGRSLQIFFEDLAQLYTTPQISLPPLQLRFCDYMRSLQAEENTEAYTRDLKYWKKRLKTLPPPPSLPRAPESYAPRESSGPEKHKNLFTTRKHCLSAEITARIMNECSTHSVSLTSFMAAVYCEVLRLWSGQHKFTLNCPRFNRRTDWHPDVNNMIGEFATFTLLGVNMEHGTSFLERTRRLQRTMWEDLEHGRVSGIRVLRERILETGQPEMQAMPIVFTAMPDRRGKQDVLENAFSIFGELTSGKGSTPQVWLDSQYFLLNNELHVSWDSQDHIFPPGLIEDMFQEYTRLLALLSDGNKWLANDIASAPQRQMEVRCSQNHRPQELPDGGVFQLFAAMAQKQSDCTALNAEDGALSYGELYALTQGVGLQILSRTRHNRMHHKHIAPPSVAVVLERGWRQPASVMAIAASGLAYLPIDPDTPPERLTAILSAAHPCLVITEPCLLQNCLSAGLEVALFDDLVASVEHMQGEPVETKLPIPAHTDPAYLMFTSGSTGVPKGVTISQGALLNAVLHSNKLFAISSKDTIFSISALHHDLSVYDIFGGLTAGAKLVVPSKNTAYAPELWPSAMLEQGITFWNSVPVFMEQLLEHAAVQKINLPLQTVVLGGDWVSPGLPERLHASAPMATLYTSGGPTETTLWNILNRVEGPLENWTSLPYGRPIPNAAYHILDDALMDAPDWVQGEMYCSGLTLCLSASLDKTENARAFATHPATGERLYRTGDLGRYRPDGLLEIIGRRDFQLNINGYRLDPAEIECALEAHPDVHRVVVTATKRDNGKDDSSHKLLSAFVVPAPEANVTPQSGQEENRLERELAELANKLLPVAMRPRRWLFLKELPLTKNGKIDRKALIRHALDSGPQKTARKNQTANAVEAFLAQAWEDVLRCSVPDMRSSFFELGGDSLQAMRVFALLEEKLNLRLPLSQIFITPTIEGLAQETYSRLASGLYGQDTSAPRQHNAM